MTNFDEVARRLYGIISGHQHQPKMFTDQGQETTDPSEARRFFVSEPNYMATVDEDTREILVNRNKNTDLDIFSSLMKKIRVLSTKYMLKTNLQVFGKQIQPKDYAMQARLKSKDKNDEVLESTMYGSRKTSYQKLEDVKIIVKHHREVDPELRGSRSRGIKAVYLQQDGERTQFPYPLLTPARAMGRHLCNGGKVSDSVGQHIMELTETMVNLREFTRYAKNMQESEQSRDIVRLAREQYESARQKLKKFAGPKTYETMCAEVTEQYKEESFDVQNNIKELFTVKQIDPRVEAALPYINKIIAQKNLREQRLLAASKQPFVLKKESMVTEDDLIEYPDPQKNMGRNLKLMINKVQESNELSEYLTGVAESLIGGNTLTEFDKRLIKNVLENSKIAVD